MRLTAVRPGDLVLIENRRGDTYFALVGERRSRELVVLPFEARAAETVHGKFVVGHYARRAGELRIVRNIVSRIRYRFGVNVGTIAADLASFKVHA